MTATPSDPTSAGSEQNPVAAGQTPIALTFEDQLQLAWRRHRALIIAGCIVVLIAIIGTGAWDYLAQQKELDVQKAYATASTPEALRAFADSHPGHPLAGVAYLRLADEAFSAGKSAEALANYEKTAVVFKDGPFAARTKLGLAMSQILSGKAGEGATALKQLADDANQYKGVRAEAAYHLTSLSAAAGVSADVLKYSDLLMQIDPAGPWTQRAFALRASLPASAIAPEPKKDASPPAPSAIQFAPAPAGK